MKRKQPSGETPEARSEPRPLGSVRDRSGKTPEAPVPVAFVTVATGLHATMLASCISSARQVGCSIPFHVWTDHIIIPGAICHPLWTLALDDRYWFKFECLHRAAFMVDAVQLVWIDADSWFVRDPAPDLAKLVKLPVWAAYEENFWEEFNECEMGEKEWWGTALADLRRLGIRWSLNGGLFGCLRDYVTDLVGTASAILDEGKRAGLAGQWTEEVPLSGAVCRVLHASRGLISFMTQLTHELSASDWTGVFRWQLPRGENWLAREFLSGTPVPVNPAVVHVMRSKHLLINDGLALCQLNGSSGKMPEPRSEPRPSGSGQIRGPFRQDAGATLR